MNTQIFFFFYNFAHQSDFLDKVIIFFAVYLPYIVTLAAIIFLLFHHEVFGAEHPVREVIKKWKEILRAFFAGALAWALAYGIKYIVHILRPFDVFSQVHPLFPENGFSFPSGHATFFSALALSIFFPHKKAGYWFILAALSIGIARIIGGVHFPADILGGFILGSLVAYFVKSV